ncbi:MAG: AbrB/MazE/SpoVT family DNA-binding domain-containing protein [Candidatus Aminicenantes bacterium]|nr:AbrB/MazE/SpoVT family DNA-binding domain-containing protein [Candidatus Aminicenantes bacterium]
MKQYRSYSGEIKDRGQLTIPKGVREAGPLAQGREVTIIPLGDSILVTPRRLGVDEARGELRRILTASGLSLNELADGLDEARGEIYEETYGRKP